MVADLGRMKVDQLKHTIRKFNEHFSMHLRLSGVKQELVSLGLGAREETTLIFYRLRRDSTSAVGAQCTISLLCLTRRALTRLSDSSRRLEISERRGWRLGRRA